MLKRFFATLFFVLGMAAHAATITPVNVGSPNAGDGDSFRAAMVKVNTSLTNLNNAIGGTNSVQAATFGSIAEMIAADPAGYLTNIYVASYYAGPPYSGGGNFYGAPSSTASTNMGLVFRSTAAAGRWIRVTSGAFNPREFGAVDDGVTDRTVNIANMIHTAEANTNAIEFPPSQAGFVASIAAITNSVGLSIIGHDTLLIGKYDASTLVYAGNTNTYFFFVGENAHNGRISGFRFTHQSGYPNLNSTGNYPNYFVFINLASDWEIDHCTFTSGSHVGVFEGGANRPKVHDNIFYNANLATGISYYNSIAFGGQLANNVAMARGCVSPQFVDNQFYGTAAIHTGIHISGSQDWNVSRNVLYWTNAAGLAAELYCGDVGFTGVGTNSWGTNHVGTFADNIIKGTLAQSVKIRGDIQQSSVAYLGAGAINAGDMRSLINFTGNHIEVTGNGIALYTARYVKMTGNRIVTSASPILAYGDCSATQVRLNYLQCTTGGTAHLATLWFGTADQNIGTSTDFVYEGNTIISAVADEWLFRSSPTFSSAVNALTFDKNTVYFFGSGNGDAGSGSPRVWTMSGATNFVKVRDNTFYLTNGMTGRILMDISCVGDVFFERNQFLPMTNATVDVAGFYTTNANTLYLRGNVMGGFEIISNRTAIITGNNFTRNTNIYTCLATADTWVQMTGNVISNSASMNTIPIYFQDVTSGLVEGNKIHINSSAGPFRQITGGYSTFIGNSTHNAGAGGTAPTYQAPASVDSGLAGELGSGLKYFSGTLSLEGTHGFRSYGVGTYLDSNTEFLEFYHNGSGGAFINTGKLGTGVNRTLYIESGGTLGLYVKSSGIVGVGGPVSEPAKLNVGGAGWFEGLVTGTSILGSTAVTGGNVVVTTNLVMTQGIPQVFQPNNTAVGFSFGQNSQDPSNATNGHAFYNTTLGALRAFIGGAWVSLGAGGGGGSGTVTSVAATVPSIFSISGSPITTAGTLAMTYSGTALPVANGGSGLTTATAHGILMGEGTSIFNVSAAGTSGQAFISGGASADGAYGALSLAGAAVTGTLPVTGGGLGVATLTAHGVVIGEGTSAVAVSTAGTSGQPFLSGGASVDGAYGALDVSSASITGVLKAAAFPALTGDITTVAAALATTLKNTGTAGTYTKVTFDAQGRETSGASAVIASSDFANQGTTTTVAHGNASGNPSWAAVSLTADVTGVLPSANGGAATGTMINTGASAAGQVPAYSDTTGVALAPSSTLTFTTTNAAFKGGVTMDNLTVTNAALVGAGSVTTPSLAWSADSDGTGTGFYRSAANEIAIALNGSQFGKFTATAVDFSPGAQDLTVGSGNQLVFSTRSAISSSADGAMAFKINAGTSRALILAAGGFNLGNTVGYGFASGSTPSTSSDTVLKRKGAGVLTITTGNGSAADLGQLSTINGVASGVVFTSTSDVTVTNTTTETTLLASGSGSATIPASALNVAGKILRVHVTGMLWATAAPTLNIKFKVGGTTIVSTGANALVGTISGQSYDVTVYVKTVTTGASATFSTWGKFEYEGGTFTNQREPMVLAGTSTADLTASKAIDVSATYGSTTGNSITSQIVTFEILN